MKSIFKKILVGYIAKCVRWLVGAADASFIISGGFLIVLQW